MRAHRRAQSARPQGMSLANLLRKAKGGEGGRVLPFIEKLRNLVFIRSLTFARLCHFKPRRYLSG